MKTILLLMFIVTAKLATAQTVSEANVYPSNLEENMYFESFNPSNNTIEGLYFMILSDGQNSQHVTPAFDVSLYLLPEGSTSKDDLITVKVYSLPGIYHFGSNEFKNEKVDLNETSGIQPGRYRLGIWVNSNEAFNEDGNDNATLFNNTIEITTATSGVSTTKQADDGWGDWDEEEEEEDDDEEW
jgi:hypothetical protein